MYINYTCVKKRKELGKSCVFIDVGPELICEINPNEELKEKYEQLKTVDRESDNSIKMCANDATSHTTPTENRGMSHREGGWPANLDIEDETDLARYRNNVEKDKNYVTAVKSLSEFAEHFILENTSIDICEDYFKIERIVGHTNRTVSSGSMFKDPESDYRKVVDLSWERSSTKFAAVYTINEDSNCPPTPNFDCYVWDIENCVKPIYVMKPEVPLTAVNFSSTGRNLLASGNISGQLMVWDIRVARHAQQISPISNSHIGKVTGVKWIKSTQFTGLLSSSSDGSIMYWDAKNLSTPVKVLNLDSERADNPNLDRYYNLSCIEYDESMPDNFMVGTEQGVVLAFSRKSEHDNDKLISRYYCEYGPTLALERNAFYPQLFMSCDPWALKLWSEDAPDAPILNITSNDGQFTDIAWNPTRASTVYATTTTGSLEIWDFPGKTKEGLLNVKIDNKALLSVAAAESGNYVICGTLSGSIHLLNVPEFLQRFSELENDFLRECIKESSEIIGGTSRSERVQMESMDGYPEKAEDVIVDVVSDVVDTLSNIDEAMDIVEEMEDVIRKTEDGITGSEDELSESEVDLIESEGELSESEDS